MDHIDCWTRITNNDVVLKWIREGVPIPFQTIPEQFALPNPKFNDKQVDFLNAGIKRLVGLGFVEKCAKGHVPKCVSPIKTVPKKNSFRLVTDLRLLNSYCNPPKFAFEDIDSVIDVTDYCDCMVTWDIKDGFFHISLKRDVIDFLGFEFDGQFYR